MWENSTKPGRSELRYDNASIKEKNVSEVKQNYKKSIEKQLEEHMKMDRSTFRVMQAP